MGAILGIGRGARVYAMAFVVAAFHVSTSPSRLLMTQGAQDSSRSVADLAILALRASAQPADGPSETEEWVLSPSSRPLTRRELSEALAAESKPIRCASHSSGSRIVVTCRHQGNTTAYRLNRETGSENLRRLKARHPDVHEALLLVRAEGESLLISERTYEQWNMEYFVDEVAEWFKFPDPDAAAAGAHAVIEFRSTKGLKGRIEPPGRTTRIG